MKGIRWLFVLTFVIGAPAAEGVETDRLGDPLPQGAIQRLGTSRMNYPVGKGLFAYLPDDRALVANGNRLEIVDLAHGACLAAHTVGANGILGLAAVADGTQVALADTAGDIAVWDLVESRQLRRWATGQKALSYICLSPDEKRLLTTSLLPGTLKEWDVATGHERIAITAPQESFFLKRYDKAEGASPEDGVITATAVQFSMGIYGPGGTTALVGDYAQAGLMHYDLGTGRLIHQWYPDIYTRQLALSPDSKRLLIGSRHRGTEWDLNDYRFLQVFTGHHGNQVTAVAYCHEPDQILTGSRDGSIRRWNRCNGQLLLRWVAHANGVTGLAISPDGRRCLSSGAGSLVESDLETGVPRLDLDRHRAPVLSCAFVPPGKYLVSSSTDGSVRLWDVAGGSTLRQFDLPSEALAAYTLAVSPDGTRLAAGGYLGIWEFAVSDARCIRTLKGHRGFVRTLAYSADSQMLLSGADDGSVKVWTANENEPVAILEGHRGGVLGLAVSSNGKQALSCGRDGAVRLWDLEQYTLRQTCRGHRGWVEAVAFLGNSDQGLSAGRDGRILKWNLTDARIVSEMSHGNWVHALVCSPDGTHAYSGGQNGQILLWDLPAGRQEAVLPGHAKEILNLAMTPDGKHLVSASMDDTLLIWKLQE